jgi:hypothetical protein
MRGTLLSLVLLLLPVVWLAVFALTRKAMSSSIIMGGLAQVMGDLTFVMGGRVIPPPVPGRRDTVFTRFIVMGGYTAWWFLRLFTPRVSISSPVIVDRMHRHRLRLHWDLLRRWVL